MPVAGAGEAEALQGVVAGVDGDAQAREAKVALADITHLVEGLVVLQAEGEAAIDGGDDTVTAGLTLDVKHGAPQVVVAAGLGLWGFLRRKRSQCLSL